MTKIRMIRMVALIAAVGCNGAVVGGEFDDSIDDPDTAFKPCDYPQVFGTAQHTGRACPEVSGLSVVGVITQDPDADAENAASGFLQIHESPPLTSGDWLIVPSKRGFTSIEDRTTEHWHVQAFRWVPSASAPNATLSPMWDAETDWRPVDAVVRSIGYITNGYVQQFAPAIANGSVYVPAAHGQLIRLALSTGAVKSIIDPLAGTIFDGDDRTIVNNAVSFDSFGNVYYTIVSHPLGNPAVGTQPRGSWLVQVRPDDESRLVDWRTIASAAVGIPAPRDLCEYPFGTSGTPPAAGPNSKPPLFGCGAQRPAINAPIAIAPDGQLVAFSYANNAQGAAFLVEIDPITMTPVRAADTRGHLLHGCGVRLSLAAFPQCAAITAGGTVNVGNDPDFNGPVRFRGLDLMDSAPAIAPNGDWAIGSYDGGFSFGGGYDSRGAGLVFHGDATFATKNEEFWWEVTPSVLQASDGVAFSYLQDRQLYSKLELTVAQYTPSMSIETLATVARDFNANAIDFLDAHIVFGPSGDHYAVNGDGHLYKFDGSGRLVDRVTLTNADGSVRSMETLSGYYARDRVGRIYASYAGRVYVIASSGLVGTAVSAVAPSSELAAGFVLKRARVATTVLPEPPTF